MELKFGPLFLAWLKPSPSLGSALVPKDLQVASATGGNCVAEDTQFENHVVSLLSFILLHLVIVDHLRLQFMIDKCGVAFGIVH